MPFCQLLFLILCLGQNVRACLIFGRLKGSMGIHTAFHNHLFFNYCYCFCFAIPKYICAKVICHKSQRKICSAVFDKCRAIEFNGVTVYKGKRTADKDFDYQVILCDCNFLSLVIPFNFRAKCICNKSDGEHCSAVSDYGCNIVNNCFAVYGCVKETDC